jgi:hypothetical protein
VRLRRLGPSLKPLSFDLVSQINTASAFNGDTGVEWLGLERIIEGGQPEGRDASDVMVAAEAAAAAAPLSNRSTMQQHAALSSVRSSSSVPSLPLSARGAAGVSQQQPLSARARVPVALVRGVGSRNTDVVPDDDAANPQPAASRLQQQQQQHPRMNVVLSGSEAGNQRPVPPLNVAGLMTASASSALPTASSTASSGAAAEVASARRPQAVVSARAGDGAAAGREAAARADGGAEQRDLRRDVVTASNISELRSKVVSCQEEVQKMKEYALELEQDNAALKQVRSATCACASYHLQPVSIAPPQTLCQQLCAVTVEREHLMGRELGQLSAWSDV